MKKKLLSTVILTLLLCAVSLMFTACGFGQKDFTVTIEYASGHTTAQGEITIVSEDGVVESGAKLAKNTTIVIAVNAGSGYKIDTFTINGVDKKSALEGSDANAAMQLDITENLVVKAGFVSTASDVVLVPDNIITDAIASDAPYVELTEDTGTVVSESAIAAIRESDKDVQIKLPSGLVITIDPSTMSNDAKGMDLNIAITPIEDAVESDYGVIIPKNSILIQPSSKGEFGLSLTFTITSAEIAEAGIEPDFINLWHISDDGVVTEHGAFTLQGDGSATITISGASFYNMGNESPYTPFGGEDWNFEDLDSVLQMFGNGNVTLFIENNYHNVTQTVFLTESTVLEYNKSQYSHSVYLIFENEDSVDENDEYKMYFYSVANSEFITSSELSRDNFVEFRSEFVTLFPYVLDNDLYDYDAETLTYTMKSDYVGPISGAIGIPGIDCFTIALVDSKLEATFYVGETPIIRSTVWNIGTTAEPNIPETRLPVGFDDATTAIVGDNNVSSNSKTYFTFTPESDGIYDIHIERSSEQSCSEYEVRFYWFNVDGTLIENRADVVGGGLQFDADTTYYFVIDMSCNCSTNHNVVINISERAKITENTENAPILTLGEIQIQCGTPIVYEVEPQGESVKEVYYVFSVIGEQSFYIDVKVYDKSSGYQLFLNTDSGFYLNNASGSYYVVLTVLCHCEQDHQITIDVDKKVIEK